MSQWKSAAQNWRIFWRLIRRLLSPLWRLLKRGK
jgi:hypothetical protein